MVLCFQGVLKNFDGVDICKRSTRELAELVSLQINRAVLLITKLMCWEYWSVQDCCALERLKSDLLNCSSHRRFEAKTYAGVVHRLATVDGDQFEKELRDPANMSTCSCASIISWKLRASLP